MNQKNSRALVGAPSVALSCKPLTDEQLAMAYINGDTRAFDMLLERNKTKIFSYILFMVRKREVADDIFQDTFLKVITRLQSGEYQPTGKFSAWVMRIAHNIVMDSFRIHNLESVVDVDEDNDMSKVEDSTVLAASIESVFVNEQTLLDVKNMMNMLPPLQREVVFMRYFQNLTFKEIAETTNISINTALGRMHYAVQSLRKMIKKNNIELTLI